MGTLSKDATLQAIAEILTSVKSVNGKYGVVVLDSGDILIAKNTTGSKTVEQVLAELQTAVAATPLEFTPVRVQGTASDYMIEITLGTPS